MVKRCNHYDAAFEAYLRARRVPYLAVDEARRSFLGANSLKNLDFLVSPERSSLRWLVDVKGRQFPAGRSQSKPHGQYWKNWTTNDELRSLGHWESLLGTGFCGLLVFAYHIRGPVAPLPPERLFHFRDAWYGFLAVRLDHYLSWARQLSVKWDTVAIPTAKFRSLARPLEELFGLPCPVVQSSA